MRALLDSFGSPFFQRALVEACLVGALGGVVGVHVLLRRLPFFVVAMSHATFPGVVLASAAGISLFVGGTAFGLVVVLAVVVLGSIRDVDDSSAIGVVLAGSFAVGVLVLSARQDASQDLSAYLVGQILTVTDGDIALTAVVGAVVLLVLAALHKELVHGAFDTEGLAVLGFPGRLGDVVVLVAVTVTMVIAVPAVGTILAVALLTVPALTARQLADRVGTMMLVAAAVGAASGVVGMCASVAGDVAAGGAIALTATAAFLVSLAARWVVEQRARAQSTTKLAASRAAS